MPVSVAELEKDLGNALESGDLDRVASARRAIVQGAPEGDLAAEASYKLGLDALFRLQRTDEAAEHFRAAAKAKSAAWSGPARVSLGILLFSQGKVQQALFELRKAASAKPATITSAQALAFMVIVHRETKNGPEAERTRTELFKALQQVAAAGKTQEAGTALRMLGAELKFDGRRDLAKKAFQAALAADIGDDARLEIEEALKEL